MRRLFFVIFSRRSAALFNHAIAACSAEEGQRSRYAEVQPLSSAFRPPVRH